MRVGGIVLAAGNAERFGSPKALARYRGRPLVQHALEAAGEVDLGPVVLVLGRDADAIEAAVAGAGAIRVRNPAPQRGLAGSLRIGLGAVLAADATLDSVVVILGDQPRTRPEVIRQLVEAARTAGPGVLAVAPRYAAGGGANPVVLLRAGFHLVDEASGDRGLGPLLASHREAVLEVPVDGSNPDVDTRADLAALAAEDWADRVRANREQVDRLREAPDGTDFYRDVSAIFRADPRRSDDPVLEELLAEAMPSETWLDIGAGAGRYALPLALRVSGVIAIDPSPAMLAGLGDGIRELGVSNIRVVEGRWPADAFRLAHAGQVRGREPAAVADVALIAHVGYDVEPIAPFLDAMEAAARDRCVALLMDRSPASVAEPFWPPVHGEPRASLPALSEFVELLEARGATPSVALVPGEPRRWSTIEELEGFLRRQLWIAPGGDKDRRFLEELDRRVTSDPDGRHGLAGEAPYTIGVVRWRPARNSSG